MKVIDEDFSARVIFSEGDAGAVVKAMADASALSAGSGPVSGLPTGMVLAASESSVTVSSRIGGIAGDVTFSDAAVVHATPQLLNQGVYFIDPATWVAGGTLSVTGVAGYDRVSLLNEGNGQGQVGIAGHSVLYGGVEIGSFAGGDGAALTVSFNNQASAAAVTAVADRLAYQLGNSGIVSDHSLHLALTDGAGVAASYANQMEPIVGHQYPDNPFAALPTGTYWAPTLGDINGDGKADLILSGNSELHWYRVGDPGYSELSSDWSSPAYEIRDGELWAANLDDADFGIRIYVNDGHGGFVPGGSFTRTGLAGNNMHTSLVDVDRDGFPDLVSMSILNNHPNDYGIYVSRNDGHGNFAATYLFGYVTDVKDEDVRLSTIPIPAAGDIDGTMTTTVLVGVGWGTMSLVQNDYKDLNDANDPFVHASEELRPGVPDYHGGKPTLIDYDGDGDLDVLLVGDSARYFENVGNGALVERFGDANPFSGVGLSRAGNITFGDIDGDGDLDGLYITTDGTVTVLWNNSNYGAMSNSSTGDINLRFDFAGTAEADAYTITTGSSTYVSAARGVLANDRVAGTLTATLVSATSQGTIVLNPDGSFTYTSTTADVTDSFSYSVSNGSWTSAPITVTLTPKPIATPLVAIDDSATALANGSVAIDMLANDDNPGGTTFALTAINGATAPVSAAITLASGATLAIDNANHATYSANGAFEALVSPEMRDRTGLAAYGSDSYSYTVGNSSATVHVGITGVDGAGDAVAPAAPTLAGLTGGVTFADRAAVTGAAQVIDSDVTLTTPATFVRDGAVLTISGLAASDLVSVQSQGNGTEQIGVAGSVLSFGGVAIGTIAGGHGDTLTITFNTAATIPGIDATIEHLAYQLGAGSNADHALHLTLTEAGSSPRSVSQDVMLSFTFSHPAGVDDAYAVDRGAVLTVTAQGGVLANDPAAASSQAVLASGPAHGALTLNADGSFSYTPDADYAGADAFTYRIDDAGLTSPPVTVALTVNDVSVPTLLLPDTATVTERGTAAIAVLANDLANDGPALAVASIDGVAAVVGVPITLASGATVTLLANGEISYDPNGRFDWLVSPEMGAATGAASSMTDSFSYGVAGGQSETVTVTITGMAGAGDQLHGTAGGDTITGLAGVANYFDLSQGGIDTATGGTMNDAFFFGDALTSADRIDGGAGTNDQVALLGDYTAGKALVLDAATITGIEVIAALAGFSYDITTNDGNVAPGAVLTFYGTTLGAGDSFRVDGSAETNGMFRMYGGLGADTFIGGAGNDGFYFGRDGRFDPLTDHVDGGGGTNDQMALDGSYTVAISGANVTNVEVLTLLDGTPATHAQYHITLDDDWTTIGETHTVYGVQVRDGFTLDASAESDGNLKIYGGLGDDTITTGAGDDWISGGAGADTLNGGSGADIYSYNKVTDSIGISHDTIINLDALHDHIDLPSTVTGIDAAIDHGALNAASFDADLTAALAGLNASHAVQFTADSGTLAGHIFEVIDTNGVAGYQAGQEMVIELQNPVTPITDTATFI